MNSSEKLADSDFPALYVSADTASLQAQRKYLNLMRVNLWLMLSGAGFGLITPSCPAGKSAMALTSAILFGCGLFLTFIIKTRRFERMWYGARAAAESIKTRAWRYMLGAEPYLLELSPKDADNLLLKDLEAILEEFSDLANGFGGGQVEARQITSKMREVRRLELAPRLEIYVSQRILGQREWYSGKAAENKQAEERLFWYFIGAQGCAFLFAVLRVRWPELINATGLFAAFASSFLAWLQIKRHQELAQSYAVAAHELGLVAEKSEHVSAQHELAIFVGDAENAISREHILWVARRDAKI